MFKKPYTISLNYVNDKVKVTEGNESIWLYVHRDASKLVTDLSNVQKQLKSLTENSPAEDQEKVALAFAEAMFGEEGAKALYGFYPDNPAMCTINICGRYFSDRLSKLITAAQKRAR